MNARTTLSAKGQVVIPKDVRDRLSLAPGDKLEVVERPDGILLRKQPAKSGESFDAITQRVRARLNYRGPALSAEEMDQAIAEMWAGGGPRWDR
jgi:AbrB family looped-hinge helix DNA binding protein